MRAMLRGIMAFRRTAYSCAATIAAFALLATAASARTFDYAPIDPKLVARFSKPAKEAYIRATEAMDKVNYDVAAEEFAEAIKNAPDSMDLRFLAIKLARYRGGQMPAGEAAKVFDEGIEHAKAIVASDHASQRMKAQAEYLLERMETQRKTVEQRDEARRGYGMQIAKEYAKQVYKKEDESKEILAYKAAVKALNDGAASGSSGAKAAAEILKKTSIGQPAVEAGAGGEKTPLTEDSEEFKAARAFTDEKLQKFFADWDFNELKPYLTPEALGAMPAMPGGGNKPEDKMKSAETIMGMAKSMLGGLKEYKVTRGEAFLIKAGESETVEAKFDIEALFELQQAKFKSAVMRKNGGEWTFSDFRLDMDFSKLLPGGMGALPGAAPAAAPPAAAPPEAAAPAAEPPPPPAVPPPAGNPFN